jgi:hypothetical protein
MCHPDEEYYCKQCLVPRYYLVEWRSVPPSTIDSLSQFLPRTSRSCTFSMDAHISRTTNDDDGPYPPFKTPCEAKSVSILVDVGTTEHVHGATCIVIFQLRMDGQFAVLRAFTPRQPDPVLNRVSESQSLLSAIPNVQRVGELLVNTSNVSAE